MKFPYGISDFKKIITQGQFYCDRTHLIPDLEKGDYLLFIRPRRFGKSLLLSTLFNYYDVAKADEFETLFAGLAIGKNPTPLRNQYFVLRWDFSCVDSSGSVQEVKRVLHHYINDRIQKFLEYYRDYKIQEVKIDPLDAISSIASLISSVRMTGISIYLFIDEFDAVANFEGEIKFLQTLFNAIKSSTSDSVFDRIFITGVLPLEMSDISSGFNIGENISLSPAFNKLCGFTHSEVKNALHAAAFECGLEEDAASDALDMMRTYCGGYKFALEAEEVVYHPALIIRFLDSFCDTCEYPAEMLDSNLSMEKNYLQSIAQIPGGNQLLLSLMREDHKVVITELVDRFMIQEMLPDRRKDRTFMASFLHYLGALTIEGLTAAGEVVLTVPNRVMKKPYVEALRRPDHDHPAGHAPFFHPGYPDRV